MYTGTCILVGYYLCNHIKLNVVVQFSQKLQGNIQRLKKHMSHLKSPFARDTEGVCTCI